MNRFLRKLECQKNRQAEQVFERGGNLVPRGLRPFDQRTVASWPKSLRTGWGRDWRVPGRANFLFMPTSRWRPIVFSRKKEKPILCFFSKFTLPRCQFLELAFFKGPPSPKRPCAPRLLFYELRVTRNCFWAGFLSKSVSSGAILSKIVQKHAGISSSIIRLLFPGIILWLSQPNVFLRSYFVQYVSCQMIPRGWRYCTVMPKENIGLFHLISAPPRLRTGPSLLPLKNSIKSVTPWRLP